MYVWNISAQIIDSVSSDTQFVTLMRQAEQTWTKSCHTATAIKQEHFLVFNEIKSVCRYRETRFYFLWDMLILCNKFCDMG